MNNTPNKLVSLLWSNRASVLTLMLASGLILLSMLGARELWTQEARWAAVTWEMLLRGDYLHPYIFSKPYYDKPLLSYWMIVGLSHVVAGLNEWALRLPSALAGILSVYCTYRLGATQINRRAGLLAGWMLISSYFFVFWARIASTDMLNVAGILLATVWYFESKNRPSFFRYSLFFLVLATASLCKGLIAVAITVLAILPDLLDGQQWKKHCRPALFFALIPGIMLYLIPFFASSLTGSHYAESGLFKVFQENIVRFFKPFDHEAPIYAYLLYLPAYLLPWTFFFIPALFSTLRHWQKQSIGVRWLTWAIGLIFLFLTVSGSRRGYYILPLVPFAMLFTASWITERTALPKRKIIASVVAITFLTLTFTWFAIIQPFNNRHDRGINEFATRVQQAAQQQTPWKNWHILMVNAAEKAAFYLKPNHPAIDLSPEQAKKTIQSLNKTHTPTIIITTKRYIPQLKSIQSQFKRIDEKSNQSFSNNGKNASVALISKSTT